MNKPFLTLLKTKRLGRLCKAGAWSILGLGIVYAIVYAFYAWNVIKETNTSSNIISPSRFDYLYSLPSVATICLAAIFSIFCFTVLYVAGTIFTTLATSLAPTQEETEDIVYESLDEPVKTRK